MDNKQAINKSLSADSKEGELSVSFAWAKDKTEEDLVKVPIHETKIEDLIVLRSRNSSINPLKKINIFRGRVGKTYVYFCGDAIEKMDEQKVWREVPEKILSEGQKLAREIATKDKLPEEKKPKGKRKNNRKKGKKTKEDVISVESTGTNQEEKEETETIEEPKPDSPENTEEGNFWNLYQKEETQ